MSKASYRVEGAQVLVEGRPPSLVHSPLLELWQKVNRRTELGLSYRFQYFAFGADTANAHGAFAGFRQRLSRHANLTVQAGPVYFARYDGSSQGFLPRVTVELGREGERVDLAVALGHDLVGASGFSSAVWADFASTMASFGVSPSFKIYGAASYFRNGRAPNVGAVPWSAAADTAVQGYAVGLGTDGSFLGPRACS